MRTSNDSSERHEPKLYEALGVIEFTLVKMKGPNKQLNIKKLGNYNLDSVRLGKIR